ncbi:hypothetical protein BRC91_12365 [Halobacteriales archaeon QS_4_62_28]|nr:MAG: hypothetical protein BRC91_12365 [Halobacteriales archaeon QS_4_62_28]
MTDNDMDRPNGDCSSESNRRKRRANADPPLPRRKALKTLGMVGTTGLTFTAGCSGDGGSTGESGGDVEPADSITIVAENNPDTAALEPLVPEFEEETGISVEMDVISYEVMTERVSTQLQSSDPGIDIAPLDHYWPGDFAEGGLLEPLESRISDSDVVSGDTYYDKVWEATATYDDTVWSIPFFHYTHVMMYRKDILEDPDLEEQYDGEYRVPETIEEFVDLCTFITESTDEDFYGCAMNGQRGPMIHDEYMDYFNGLGGEFVTPDGEVMLGDHKEAAVEALELYIENMEEGAPEASKQWNFINSTEAMTNEEAFSMLSYVPLFSPIVEELGDKVGIAQVPGKRPPLFGWSWSIPANLDEQRAEAAWQFIEWIESFESRKRRAMNGAVPTAPDVVADEEVIETNPPFFEIQESLLNNAQPWPNVPGTNQVVQDFGTELSQAVAGEKTPEEAISAGIERVENILQ